MTPILILAAGQSRRMRGRDKLAEPVDGQPLLRAQALRALDCGAPVFVALPAPDHPRRALLAGLDVMVLAVPEAAEGMGGSLRGAVAQLPDCNRFLLVLADLPELTAADLRTLLAAPDKAQDALIWRGTDAEGRPGHPILFDARLRPLFALLGGDDGGREIVAAHRDRTAMIPLPDHHATRDLDTPEQWAEWRASR